jgi:hypothetical protein
LDKIELFFIERYRDVVWKVIINLSICLGSVILIATLLGTESMISFLLGLNFIGFYYILLAVITGNSE